jgi:hypothetical protein
VILKGLLEHESDLTLLKAATGAAVEPSVAAF